MRSRRAPRKRPEKLRLLLVPTLFLFSTQQAAFQDLSSQLAREANITERARAHLMQGALSSLKTATLSLPTNNFFALPDTQPRLTPRIDVETTGSIPPLSNSLQNDGFLSATINRANKSDRIVAAKTPDLPRHDIALSLELDQQAANPASIFDAEARADRPGSLFPDNDLPEGDPTVMFRMSSLLFEAEVDATPPGAFKHRQYVAPGVVPDMSPDAPLHATRKLTPAERLGLNASSRAKAVKCLAEAIYFEARSEPERGQAAVAQVVINRAFSGYYPNDICGVVYQNKHRHLACQFTFACDGIPDIVYSKPHWALADRLANEALDGKTYLQDVGKATHYHAYYVSPYWARKMRKLVRIGAHTFYFPFEWEVNEPTVTAGQ